MLINSWCLFFIVFKSTQEEMLRMITSSFNMGFILLILRKFVQTKIFVYTCFFLFLNCFSFCIVKNHFINMGFFYSAACLCEYYTQLYFDNPNCSGSFYTATGANTACYPANGNGLYQMVICQSEQFLTYDCSDSSCNNCNLSLIVPTGCSSIDGGGSVLYGCSSSPPVLPSYYSQFLYTSNDCSVDFLLSYTIFPTGHCSGSTSSSYHYYMCNNGNPQTITCSDQACSQNCNTNTVQSGCYPISGTSYSTYQGCFTSTSVTSTSTAVASSSATVATMSSSTSRSTSSGKMFFCDFYESLYFFFYNYCSLFDVC